MNWFGRLAISIGSRTWPPVGQTVGRTLRRFRRDSPKERSGSGRARPAGKFGICEATRTSPSTGRLRQALVLVSCSPAGLPHSTTRKRPVAGCGKTASWVTTRFLSSGPRTIPTWCSSKLRCRTHHYSAPASSAISGDPAARPGQGDQRMMRSNSAATTGRVWPEEPARTTGRREADLEVVQPVARVLC